MSDIKEYIENDIKNRLNLCDTCAVYDECDVRQKIATCCIYYLKDNEKLIERENSNEI